MTPQKAPIRLDRIGNADQLSVRAGAMVLRPLRRADQGLIEHWVRDPRVARGTRSIPHPYPPGAADAYVTRVLSGEASEVVWAIDGTDAGLAELLGLIGLQHVEDRQWEIGYWVAPDMWNTGIASTAVQALVAANPLGAETVFASVFQDNPASAQVLLNAGFEYIGDAEAFSVARGARVATWTYLLRREARD
jgi:RimJ/RimL family protein N-acetyltransferase